MKIEVYKLSEFGYSGKALWLRGVWSYPRLEPRYKNLFIIIKITESHMIINTFFLIV